MPLIATLPKFEDSSLNVAFERVQRSFNGTAVLTDLPRTITALHTLEQPTASAIVLRGRVEADVDYRFEVQADGKLWWGDGTNPQDVNLYRSAANTLKTDDAFAAGNGLTVSAGTTAVQALTASGRITADASGPDGIVFAADGTSGNSARAFFMNNTPTGWVIANVGGSLDFRGAAASPGATSGASQMLLTAAVGLRPATPSGLTLGTATLPWGSAWMGALTASGQIKNDTTSATLLGHDSPATGNPRLDVVGPVDTNNAGQIVLAQLTTDATQKIGVLGVRHQTNAQKPMAVILGTSDGINNKVWFGVGTSNSHTIATVDEWYTAANDTSTVGTIAADLTGVGPDAVFGLRGAYAMYVKAADPAGITNAAHIYAKDVATSAEVFVRDEGGTATQISPHNPETGEWYQFSVNDRNGWAKRIHVERFIEDTIRALGLSRNRYIEDFPAVLVGLN